MRVERYSEQAAKWPASGRHLLAQFNDESVIVYQAYRPSIAEFACRHRYFGGPDFSFTRMTWIKPSFLWMMHRSSWATKRDQERVIAIYLYRAYFEGLLARAVSSSYDRDSFEDRGKWADAVKHSEVRVQWDPDHDPMGRPLARRAIQIGIRGAALDCFLGDAICSIDDITAFVNEQREHARKHQWPSLMTPIESEYPIADFSIRQRLGILESVMR